MWSTPSLALLPGSFWPLVVAPDRVLSLWQIELFDHLNRVQTNDLWEIELLEKELSDHITVYKKNDWCFIELLETLETIYLCTNKTIIAYYLKLFTCLKNGIIGIT